MSSQPRPIDMEKAIKTFNTKKIPVHVPGEDDYERYVATSNLLYRFSTPPCVVRPKCACDVRDIIRIAEPLKIPITIKNGGHSYAGGSTTNIGILMELGQMNRVDLDQNTVTVKGGALWFNVYRKLVSERRNGVVVNGGRCPTVGVSGFMLGGGLSPFTRSFGMGCDTVQEFTIVTAKGDEVTVSGNSQDEDKRNLFWALRGAGGGNFGVVVEMKLALQKLRSDVVVAGKFMLAQEHKDMDGFVTTMDSFYSRTWPDEMTIDSSWVCDLENAKPENDLAVRYLIYYNGGREDFNRTVDQWTLPNAPQNVFKAHENLKTQLKRRTLEEKSSRFLHETLAAQWIEETKKAMPSGDHRVHQIYSSFVFKNHRKDVEKITRIIRAEMEAFRKLFKGEKALLQVTFIHCGGAANQKQRGDTAFRWRGCTYIAYIMIEWTDKWLEQDMRGFLATMKPKLGEFSMVRGAKFANFPDDTLTAFAHEPSYYGNNHQRLRRIKKIWDPNNYFNWSQGIRPGETRDISPNQNDDNNLVEDLLRRKEYAKDMTDVLAEQQWETYRPLTTEVYGSAGLPSLVY